MTCISHNSMTMDETRKKLIRRLKRVTLSIYDLERAEVFATEILNQESRSTDTEVVDEALDLALRVSYSRPFSGNRTGSDNDFDRDLESSDLSIYTPSERELHNEVLQSRNQFYTHSDPDPYKLVVGVSEGGVVISGGSNDPIRSLMRGDVRRLKSMMEKLSDHLLNERHRLGEKIGPGKY